MFKERSSDLPKRGLQSLFCRLHTRQPENLCVCVTFFFLNRKDSHGALAIKQLVHRVLVPRTSTSHRLTRSDRKGLDDAQEVFSRAQPVSQVFQPCTERLSRAMRRRCNASSKLEQMSNSRTRPPIARGPWSLQRVWDAYPSAFPPWPLEKRVAAAGFTYNK